MDMQRLQQLAGVTYDDIPVMEAVEIPENVGLEDIERMFDAARRGLGIVNKLKNPAERKKHAPSLTR